MKGAIALAGLAAAVALGTWMLTPDPQTPAQRDCVAHVHTVGAPITDDPLPVPPAPVACNLGGSWQNT